jgi:hypothetical protein
MMGAYGADDDVGGVVLRQRFKKLRLQIFVHSASASSQRYLYDLCNSVTHKILLLRWKWNAGTFGSADSIGAPCE